MSWLKRLLGLHQCDPGIPHRNVAGLLVVTCYTCGREKAIEWDLEVRAPVPKNRGSF